MNQEEEGLKKEVVGLLHALAKYADSCLNGCGDLDDLAQTVRYQNEKLLLRARCDCYDLLQVIGKVACEIDIDHWYELCDDAER